MLHRPPQSNIKKPSINHSFTLTQKLNKSRSILQKSILRCALSENNADLGRSLATKEAEILELRKENIRLTRENYDVYHTGQFRTFNYNSYMMKFSELSEVALTLFTQVCKLSDDIVEMKNHPFISGKNLSDTANSTTLETTIPAAFETIDKIPRSPLNSLREVNDTETSLEVSTDQLNNLVSRIAKVKNQSNHSIHNISFSVDANTSLVQKLQKTDTSHYLLMSPTNQESQKKEVKKPVFKKLQVPSVESAEKENFPKTKISRRKKLAKYDDAIVLSGIIQKPDKRRRKNLAIINDAKKPNKEEYKKHKENDAYHLSMNETINTTIVPPSLNEFSNQQRNIPTLAVTEDDLVVNVKESINNENIKDDNENNVIMECKNNSENELIDKLILLKPSVEDIVDRSNEVKVKENMSKDVTKKVKPNVKVTKSRALSKEKSISQNLKMLSQASIYVNDDDDDFILPTKDKVKKRNILDDSMTVDIIEKNIKKVATKSKAKAKTCPRPKRKVKEIDESPDKVTEIKNRRKCYNNADQMKDIASVSDISMIINQVIEDVPSVKRKVRRKKNV